MSFSLRIRRVGRRAAAGLVVALLVALVVLLVGGPARAQPARPEHRASAARLLARLGPLKNELPAIRAEQARLWRTRSAWRTEPLAFLGWRRLGRNFRALERPDSVLYCMRQAQAAAAPLRGAYPLDLSRAVGEMGDRHWARQAADSAAVYYRASVALLARAGPDTLRRRAVPLLQDSLPVGTTLAQAAANTGLALRRRGDLVVALGYYERALRLFEHHAHTEGVLWVLSLLGEAYEEQGNDARAMATYARALAVARRYATTDPSKGLQALADLSTYTHDLLLRRKQAAAVRALVQAGDSLLPTVLALPVGRTHPWEAAAAAATLAVRGAEAELAAGPPVEAALTRADARLTTFYRVTADHAFLRVSLHYYELRAEYHALRAAAGFSPETAGATAVAYADSVATPGARHRIGPVVARLLLRAGQPERARQLLRAAATAARTHTDRLALRTVLELLADTYAALGRYDSAYVATRRAQSLTDTIRATQQYAALAAVETRYQTVQQQARITQLAARGERESRQKQVAWGGLAVLALGLGGVAWVLRRTRRLNQRLAAQRQLLEAQAEQLTELDRAKSAFFANVSHELRTPLTLIVGPVEQTLQQADAAWDAPTLRERLTLTLRNGRRLQGLVNGLLDFSKLDAGRLTAHPALVQAAPFFRELLAGFAPLAEERRIHLTATVELPDARWLLFDADKVEKVTTNLLANALKFTPAGGRVAVEVGADAAAPDQYRLTVRDTGPGIAPPEQARVFERFYQVRAHGEQGGTGIGLALSRELAGLLGGALTLTSRVGEGSTFSFTFRAPTASPTPAARTAAAETAPLPADDAPVRRPDGQRPRVLVVEDNADLRAYLRQILAPHYEVVEAEHGRQALAILAQDDIDLISSDAMMPELDGLGLLTHVRAHPQWRRLPFVMLTARAATEHRLAALELGVDDYLPKPFLARELLARVRNLLVNYYERVRWLAAPDAEPAPLPPDEAAADTLSPPLELAAPALAPAATLMAPAVAGAAPPDAALLAALRGLVPAVLADPAYAPAALAAALGLSERTLYRRLKEQTGLTPAGWLREARLDHARHLLDTRAHATVAEVAYAVGFEDANYFGQAYTKRFGKRPSEYLAG